MKVIASGIRKGNIIEHESKLYTVLVAESFFPGKGVPTTQVDMRRISDGVKISLRYKTTEQVERAYIEEQTCSFLYQDGEGYHFMNQETYDQFVLDADLVGDRRNFLKENMTCGLSIFEGLPISVSLPQKATFKIVEADPVVKGQSSSSSYKPAVLENGARILVPPHITSGVSVVVDTETGAYVERAKD